MSWNTNKAYANISQMLEKEDCSLIELIKDNNIKLALKKKIPNLQEFLVEHSGRLVDIALSVEKTDVNQGPAVCYSLIVNPNKQFTNALLANDDFLEHLNAFISMEKEVDENGATGFARILQFLIQSTGGSVFNRWPQREELFGKLIQQMDHIAIHSIIEDITNDSRKAVIAFLEDCHASNIILSKITQDDLKKNRRLYLYLGNIVSGIEIDSPLLSVFEGVDVMKDMYELALKTPSTQLSSQVFNTISKIADVCDVTSQFEDENGNENEDPLIESVIKYGYNRLNDICDFLKSENIPFVGNKDNASRLVNILLLRTDSIPQCVFDYMKYLFDQIFEHPTHSIMHQTFSLLFDTIMTEQEQFADFVRDANIKYRIREIYEKRGQINAAYWGLLFQISKKIDSLIPSKEDDDWQNFKETTINKTETLLNAQYGGKLPSYSDSSDSEEVEFPLGRSQLQSLY